MAIYIKTNDPKQLFEKIKTRLGELINPAWKLDADGDLEYRMLQYNTAWFRAYFNPKNLTFGIIGTKNNSLLTSTYSLYHAEIAKFLLNNFHNDIISIRITPHKIISIDKYE